MTFGRHRHPRFDGGLVNGVEILAPTARRPAVYAGRVVFARCFPDYGNMAVLDTRRPVLTLYAGLRRFSQVGSRRDGGPNRPGRGRSGETEPSLYFEVRHRQKAADPLTWLR